MKNALILLTLFLIVPVGLLKSQSYYELNWKTVENNKKQGLFKSNLPLLKDIEAKAIEENKAVELIRSLKEQFAILNLTSDDENNRIASEFFSSLQKVSPQLEGEAKRMFEVLKSEFLYEYYLSNRWKIQARTNVLNADYSQIESWSALDFKTEIGSSLEKLAKNRSELESVKMVPYQKLFGAESDLEYVETLWVYYRLQQTSYLKDSGFFTSSELSQNRKQIQSIYKDLIDSSRGNSKLFLEHQKLLFDCESEACENKLERLTSLYQSTEEDLDYKVKLIEEMVQELISKNKLQKAREWTQVAISTYPNSPFLEAVRLQKRRIEQPVVQVVFPTQVDANQPIHLVAEHKNATKFSLRLYEASGDKEGFLKIVQSSYQKDLYQTIKKSLVKETSFTLPKSDDFQLHKTAFSLDGLVPGLYIGEYQVDREIDLFYFLVSEDRVLVQKNEVTKGSKDRFQLQIRASGKAIGNSEIQLLEYVRGASFQPYQVITNANGEFVFPTSSNENVYRYYLVESRGGKGFSLLNRYGENGYRSMEEKQTTSLRTQLFMDRAIYRPGQVVYFKGIVSEYLSETQNERVAPGIAQSVELVDSNGVTVGTKEFVSGDYGSYHGSFTLPTSVLPGTFYLRTKSGQNNSDAAYRGLEMSKSFRVEEYKRPNFEVVFEPVKGEYQYGQSLTLKGKAESYSGVPMANTPVTYEIKKENIRWMYFRWFPQTPSNENSILGETTTNEKGEFEIQITLNKDPNLKGMQVDRYEVSASVLDLNGESISSQQAFKVASVSHYLEAEGKEAYLSDEPTEFSVQVKNYSDQDLERAYLSKLEMLEGPSKLYRDQYKPYIQDLAFLSREEFAKKFPYDRYDLKDLEKESSVKKVVFENRSSQGKTLSLGKLTPGIYELTLYNKEGTDTIQAKRRFEVFNPKGLSSNQTPFVKLIAQKDSLQKGESTVVYAYSAVPGAIARFFIQNGDGNTLLEEKPFIKGVAKLEVSAPKDPKSEMLLVQVQVSSLGEVQTKSVEFKIVQPSRDLTIETTVFRDKLEPGQAEKWSVKIKGKGKERINAELLATMYDKSLDTFVSNLIRWNPRGYTSSYFTRYDHSENFTYVQYSKRVPYARTKYVQLPTFSWMDLNLRYSGSMVIRGTSSMRADSMQSQAAKLESQVEDLAAPAGSPEIQKQSDALDREQAEEPKVPLRENLNETAFFFPELRTDQNGNVHFEFTSPEALTQWRLQFLAHTKDLQIGMLEKEVVTQKKLSLTVNYPRFLREGDQMELKTRISSLVDSPLKGNAKIAIYDASTLEDLTEKFGLTKSTKSFDLKGNSSALVEYSLRVPKGVSAILVRTTAQSGEFSDGEQKPIAILPNRKLVTESRAIFVRENEKKTFQIENLLKGGSSTMQSVRATLELSSNPIWEVLFALPSLMQDTQKSADSQFNKWVAEVIAQEVLKQNPRMEQVFLDYRSKNLLESNLEKNKELKELLLKETPWVLESENQKQQMGSLARLLDRNSMKASSTANWAALERLQNPDGGFSWQPGAPSSYYTSLYLLKNLGRLNQWMGKDLNSYSSNLDSLVKKLVSYVDREVERFDGKPETLLTSNSTLNYLDARHYWETSYPLKGVGLTLKTQFIKKAPSFKPSDYTFYGLHRGALLLHEYKLTSSSKKLLTYLKETAVDSQTQGMYWKENAGNWGWFSSSVSNHAGALEAFNTLAPTDQKTVEELKIWLLTQKEVSHWDTSRATAEVIYLLLDSGKSWTGVESDQTQVLWGGESVKEDLVVEAPGYLKAQINSKEISKEKGQVEVYKKGPGIAQGGLYYQYYEDLDKIGSASSVISIDKEYYKVTSTTNGEVLEKISALSPLKIGDRVKVRMVLNFDRPMEYLHLRDQRAAGLEPSDTLSTYVYSGGLGYYKALRDASVDFYFEGVSKGKHVLEYELRANASGTFSAGNASIQNYYAPQMSAHTKGEVLQVRE
ncbi:alpha-2-macroglobulin family protein [Chryseobacterium sp. A301]